MDADRNENQAIETFRPRRFYRNLGLGGVLGYPAWAVVGIWISLTEPGVPSRIGLVAIMGGIPLGMTAVSAWILARIIHSGSNKKASDCV